MLETHCNTPYNGPSGTRGHRLTTVLPFRECRGRNGEALHSWDERRYAAAYSTVARHISPTIVRSRTGSPAAAWCKRRELANHHRDTLVQRVRSDSRGVGPAGAKAVRGLPRCCSVTIYDFKLSGPVTTSSPHIHSHPEYEHLYSIILTKFFLSL